MTPDLTWSTLYQYRFIVMLIAVTPTYSNNGAENISKMKTVRLNLSSLEAGYFNKTSLWGFCGLPSISMRKK